MKERLTISVDADLAAEAAAVADGRAESVSGWVGEAMRDRVAKERRLAALAEAVAAHEREHGDIDVAAVEGGPLRPPCAAPPGTKRAFGRNTAGRG